MPVDAKEWTLSGLSVELRMDHRGLSKKIEDVKPCRENKRSRFYRMADVVRALVDGNKAAQPFEESRARKMAADADLAEIKAAMLSRDVIELDTGLEGFCMPVTLLTAVHVVRCHYHQWPHV